MNKEEKPVHDLPPVKEVVVSPKGKEEIKKELLAGYTKEVKPKEEPKAKEEVVVMADPTLSYARLVRMERMLEWLVVQRVTDDQKLIKQPNIADIFKEIASKMDDKKTASEG